MTLCKKYAAALAVYGAMDAICTFSYLSQDPKEYTEPSLFNAMVATAAIGTQIGIGFALRYIYRNHFGLNVIIENPPVPPLWEDRIQQNSNFRERV